MIMSWVEKYRPKEFDDIVGQEHIVNYYRKWKECGGKPSHAIFKGRCGIGKTSLAYVIENEFGVKMMPINGSADRSLTYFRDTMIPTWKCLPLQGKFRFVCVDETENMLNDAWMVLKSPLENYAHNVVVVFLANNDSNIPEAIRSRCEVFDFAPISKNDIVKRLRYIADQECYEVEDRVLEIIAEKGRGDLRKAVTLLEDSSRQALEFGKDEFRDMFVMVK